MTKEIYCLNRVTATSTGEAIANIIWPTNH